MDMQLTINSLSNKNQSSLPQQPATESDIYVLNDDCLARVFSFLDTESISKVAQTSKRLKILIEDRLIREISYFRTLPCKQQEIFKKITTNDYYRNQFPEKSASSSLPAVATAEHRKIMSDDIEIRKCHTINHNGCIHFSTFLDNSHLIATVSCSRDDHNGVHSLLSNYDQDIQLFDPINKDSNDSIFKLSHKAFIDVRPVYQNGVIITHQNDECSVRQISNTGDVECWKINIPLPNQLINLAVSPDAQYIGILSYNGELFKACFYKKLPDGTISEIETVDSPDGSSIQEIIFDSTSQTAVIQGGQFHAILYLDSGALFITDSDKTGGDNKSQFSQTGNIVITTGLSRRVLITYLQPDGTSTSSQTLIHSDTDGDAGYNYACSNRNGTHLITSEWSYRDSNTLLYETALWKLRQDGKFEIITSTTEKQRLNIACFNNNETFAAAGTENGKLHIFDLSGKKSIESFKFNCNCPDDHTLPVKSLCFNNLGNYLMAAADNGEIILFEYSIKDKQWREKAYYQYSGRLLSVQFSPDERFLLVTGFGEECGKNCEVLEIVPKSPL